MEEVRSSINSKHSVQPGSKVSPRDIKLYHQAISNPYHQNEFEKSVFNQYNITKTSRQDINKLKDRFH